MNDVDVIIMGLGAMGSAALEQLSRTGLRVLGIEQFESPHAYGSSHGESRIIRKAYFEDPLYVPLLQRAYQLWTDLEQRAQQRLYYQTGGLMIGPPDGSLIQGTLDSVRTHDLTHLYQSDLATDDPHWNLPADYVGVYENEAGFLLPEACIAAHLQLAQQQGASLWQQTRVLDWQQTATGVIVQTDRGQVSARRLINTSGAWMPQTYPRSAPELAVTRQILFWFAPPDPSQFADFPVFLLELEPDLFLYGFPTHAINQQRFKVALHFPGEPISPQDLPQTQARPAEIEQMQALLRRYLKSDPGPCVQTKACLYTNTQNGHFRWYEDQNVLALSACSGHGFKFATVMGELLKQWAQQETIHFDLGLFQRS